MISHKSFVKVGIILTVIGLGLLAPSTILSHFNQPDYFIQEEIPPGDFLGEVELIEGKEIHVSVFCGDCPIKISISSQDGIRIWEEDFEFNDSGYLITTFENTYTTGIYSVKTTNLSTEPTRVSVKIIDVHEVYSYSYFDFFWFDAPTFALFPLYLGIPILFISSIVFLKERRKINQQKSE